MRAALPRDAAVTGIGCATPFGFGADASWDALLAGRLAPRAAEGDGTDPRLVVARIEEPWLRARVAAELEPQAKFLNGAGQLAASAVGEAVEASGALAAGTPPRARGLFVAQVDFGATSFDTLRPAFLEATENSAHPADPPELNAATLRRVTPFYLLDTLHNNSFSFLSAWQRLEGANTSLSGWTGPGAMAVSLAARAVARGDAEAAVAAGAARLDLPAPREEAWRFGVLAGQPSRVETMGWALDRARGGAVPAQGAAALVLEPLGAARARGARVLAVVLGHGLATVPPPPGAHGPTAEGLAAAGREAMREAGVAPADLLGVVVPGDGSAGGDRAALGAARALLRGAPVPVVAWRGATGLMGVGSDAFDVATAARALSLGVLPGTPRFDRGDDGFETVRVAREAVRGPGRAVLTLTGGLDGTAVALVLATA